MPLFCVSTGYLRQILIFLRECINNIRCAAISSSKTISFTIIDRNFRGLDFLCITINAPELKLLFSRERNIFPFSMFYDHFSKLKLQYDVQVYTFILLRNAIRSGNLKPPK